MQRKRHINFKLHSIPILLNMKKSASRNSSLNSVNNCNYEKKNVKSNVLYSIPCVKSCAHTFCRAKLFNSNKLNNTTFAILCLSMISLVSLMGGDKCSAATTASLSLSNPNMTSSAITPGSTATVSTNVTVSVDNAESYSLSLKVDNANLTNGSTTIVPGNVTNDNTWGYKWDNATSYTAPSTTGATLTNSTLVPLDSNGAVSFTKNLTFGAKFSTSAEAGHYRGSGVLSLVATPKIVGAQWSNGVDSGITTMQEMTPEICNQVTTPKSSNTVPSIVLMDSRTYPVIRGNAVSNKYKISKLQDGRCWMVDNLRLTGSDAETMLLTNEESNVPTSGYELPTSNAANFNTTYKSAYYNVDLDTAYYTYCVATAGTCTSNKGSNSTNDICPKGWRLPNGGDTGEFAVLYSSAGNPSALELQNNPYHFLNTGNFYIGEFKNADGGYWWSRTGYHGSYVDGAYGFSIQNGTVSVSADFSMNGGVGRFYGLAARCILKTTE